MCGVCMVRGAQSGGVVALRGAPHDPMQPSRSRYQYLDSVFDLALNGLSKHALIYMFVCSFSRQIVLRHSYSCHK